MQKTPNDTVAPRTPNERDESSDSQAKAEASQQQVGKIAHDDLKQGQKDTDKGPVLDATYDKVVGHEKK